MGYDADEPVALGELTQRAHGLPERFLVERAEALIYEERVHLHAAGARLDLLRKPERERERGKKRFAAGE